MTQKQLADHIGCDVKVINRNAQLAVDIYRASKNFKKVPKPLPMAG